MMLNLVVAGKHVIYLWATNIQQKNDKQKQMATNKRKHEVCKVKKIKP
jgi:hypothetical protein